MYQKYAYLGYKFMYNLILCINLFAKAEKLSCSQTIHQSQFVLFRLITVHNKHNTRFM